MAWRLHRAGQWLSTSTSSATCRGVAFRSHRQNSTDSSLPRIASPSLWTSLIPKPLRRKSSDPTARTENVASKEWNPATFFIIMSLLVGSNAIQMVSLKTQRINYKRTTEAKLSLLREVINRVKKGEDVDVEAMLGTGDPEREKEWEEMIRDLEQEDNIFKENKVKKEKPRMQSRKQETTKTVVSGRDANTEPSNGDRKPGFY